MMFDPTSGDLQETGQHDDGNSVRTSVALSGDVEGDSTSVYHMRLIYDCQVIYKKRY